MTITGGDTFIFEVTAEDENCYLFANFVAIDGFDITVNGKKAEFIENGLDLMLIKLDQGENVVVVDYHSPYIKLILLGVLAAAIVAVLVWLIKSKFKKAYLFAEKAVPIAAVALALLVFGFFIAYPSAVFVIKLFKLIFAIA